MYIYIYVCVCVGHAPGPVCAAPPRRIRDKNSPVAIAGTTRDGGENSPLSIIGCRSRQKTTAGPSDTRTYGG